MIQWIYIDNWIYMYEGLDVGYTINVTSLISVLWKALNYPKIINLL